MKVATYQSIRTIKVDELTDPEVGPHDVVLSVRVCGICGTDVHSYLEGSWVTPGSGMGHEYAGIVTEVGREVADIAVGDRCAVNPIHSCGICTRCSEGRSNLCGDMTGASPGFAEKALVRGAKLGTNIFRLPDDVDFDAATFLEPMSVAVRAIRMTEPILDEPILVVGLGSIGQCIVQALRAYGSTTVVGVDTSELRRRTALRSGAHSVYDPADGDLVETLIGNFGCTPSPYHPRSGSFAAAFECAGAPGVLGQIATLIRAGGAVSLIAATDGPIEVDPTPFVQKEARLLGSFAYSPEDCSEAFELIASRRVHPDRLISHRFSLAEIDAAMQTQCQGNTSVKVVVQP
ncbi:zinc-dependent alcohol dehydrogenase [Rhodococcus triatomae]